MLVVIVAMTEAGFSMPKARLSLRLTFSACFGAAFLPLHPTKYADLLQHKLAMHDTHVYLVNTGWSGGAYGVGKRMKIKDTRACIDAILDGTLVDATYTEDPVFGFSVPTSIKGGNPDVVIPRNAWADKAQYDATAAKLAGMFKKNFTKYVTPGVTDYSPYGPK